MFEKYRLKSYGKTELIYRDEFWRPNLITNYGLNRIGSGLAMGTYLHIGTGTTTPAFADVNLTAFSAASSSVTSISKANAGSPNYEVVATSRYQFNAGVLNGTYTEIGAASSNTGTSGTCSSHALILDASGNPSSVSVIGPDEILQVTYRLKWFPPLGDVTGSIDISGSGTHSYTARAFNVTGAQYGYFNDSVFNNFGTPAVYASTGSLVANTASEISGTIATINGAFNSYVTDSFSRGFNVTAGISEGNLSGGIKSIYISMRSAASSVIYQSQIEFTPAIPKDSTKSLTMPFSFSWARHA